jgi:hypothetical protein
MQKGYHISQQDQWTRLSKLLPQNFTMCFIKILYKPNVNDDRYAAAYIIKEICYFLFATVHDTFTDTTLQLVACTSEDIIILLLQHSIKLKLNDWGMIGNEGLSRK